MVEPVPFEPIYIVLDDSTSQQIKYTIKEIILYSDLTSSINMNGKAIKLCLSLSILKFHKRSFAFFLPSVAYF
jgi:hypothetical protein